MKLFAFRNLHDRVVFALALVVPLVVFGGLSAYPLKASATVTRSSDEMLLITGPITSGDERVLAALLDADGAHYKMVGLVSPGGDFIAAYKMAEAIRGNGLDTYILGECASACTTLAQAGVHRYIAPGGTYEVHQISFPQNADVVTIPIATMNQEVAELQYLVAHQIDQVDRHGGKDCALLYSRRAYVEPSHTDLYIFTTEELGVCGFQPTETFK
jgi:hypothetical protein